MPSYKDERDEQIARLQMCEITFGDLLGSGGFSDVYSITRFNLRKAKTASKQKLQKEEDQARNRLASRAKRRGKGDERFSIKVPKQGLTDPKIYEETMDHFFNEIHVLTTVNHPNILKIRGLVKSDYRDCYCIIVDRLEGTLEDRINRWKLQTGKMSKTVLYRRFRDRTGYQRRALLAERVMVALGIARALCYLHDRNMIYRDVKPANVGFNADNETILFDMGLCREMPAKGLDNKFQMSGKGTIRYMSPEVRRHERYNEKADVYSFAHLLWEILALEKPYAGFSCEMHAHRVVVLGQRPTLDDSWPEKICYLLELAWDADPSRRIPMKRIQRMLEEVLTDMSRSEIRMKRLKMAPATTAATVSTRNTVTVS